MVLERQRQQAARISAPGPSDQRVADYGGLGLYGGYLASRKGLDASIICSGEQHVCCVGLCML